MRYLSTDSQPPAAYPRNEIDENMMMAADDAFGHHDRVAGIECPGNAHLANLAGLKFHRDVLYSWFQFPFRNLEFSVFASAKDGKGSADS